MTEPYHCVVNRLRLRGLRHQPAFLRASFASAAAARETPGNVRVKLLGLPPLRTYLTLTVWKDEAAVMRFLADARHREAAAHMDDWASEGQLVRFASPTPRVGWRTALRQLRDGAVVQHRPSVRGAASS